MIVSLVIYGQPKEEEEEDVEIIELETPDDDWIFFTHHNFCKIKNYEIIIVDELIPENCYALRYEEMDQKTFNILSDSIKYEGMDPYNMALSQNLSCSHIQTEGKMLCQKNYEQCIKLEQENKICIVYKGDIK